MARTEPGQRRPAPPVQPRPDPVVVPAGVGATAGTVPGSASAAASMAAGAGGEAAIAGTTAAIIAAMLAVLARLRRRRRAAIREWLLRAGLVQTDIELALTAEDSREAVYRILAERRVKLGTDLAMKTTDPSTRAAAIESVMRREQRFAAQRAAASGERVLAAAELQELRRTSPQGAFWLLGPRRTHTPDCIAMAGRFWPWPVLNIVHPLLHTGCGCYLRSQGFAIANGLMTAADIPTDRAAQKAAAPIIKHVRDEQAAAQRKYGALTEGVDALEAQATDELEVRLALAEAEALPVADLACQPLASDPQPAPPHLREEQEPTGAMVALFPDPKVAKALALRGGSKPEDLHVTLAFFGEAEGLPLDKAKAAVEAWAKKTPPMSGELSGIGHFDIGKGETVTYRSVDLPDLPAPREGLVKALDRGGVPPKRDHGFTPHMTIDQKMRRPPVKKQPITFDTVTLAWGGDRHVFPLAGKKSDS